MKRTKTGKLLTLLATAAMSVVFATAVSAERFDNQEALQNFLDTAQNTDSKEVVLEGSVTLTSPLEIPAGVTLKGGNNAKIISTSNPSESDPSVILNAGSSLEGIEFSEGETESGSEHNFVRIIGGDAKVSSCKFTAHFNVGDEEVSRGVLTYAGQANGFVIENCEFNNIRQPGYLQSQGKVKNCTVNTTKGWVVCANYQVEFIDNTNFTGNADNNTCNICIIANKQTTNEYANGLIAMSKANPGAYIIDQLQKAAVKDGEYIVASKSGETKGTDLQKFATFDGAMAVVANGETITLLNDLVMPVGDGSSMKNQGFISINKSNITINGNGNTVSIPAENGQQANVVEVDAASNVKIKNLKIVGNAVTGETYSQGAKHGVNIWNSKEVSLDDVDISNCFGYGVVCNSSTVIVSNVNTKGNGWGGLNADSGSEGKETTLTVKNATCEETNSVKVENNEGNGTVPVTVTIEDGTFKNVSNLHKYTTLTLYGGKYASDVQTYCAQGLAGNVPVEGYYLVHKHDSNVESKAAVAPTCTKAGSTAEMSCSVCGTVTVSPVVDKATGHNLKPVEAVAATTEKEGNLAYYVCQKDNSEWFWDAAGNNPIANHSAVVTAKLTSQTEELNSEVGKPEETFTVTAEGSAAPVEVKIDTDKLMENTADTMATVDTSVELKNKAVEELAKQNVTATAEEVTLILTPAVEVENVKVDEQKATITMDISLVCKAEAKAGGAVVPVAKETVPNDQIKQDTVITMSVPASWNGKSIIVRHETKDRGVKFYSAVAANGVATFTVPAEDGFSPFTLFVDDGKTVTVKLDNETKTYNRTDVVNETALPAPSKYNYAFKGWKFEGIDGQHFNMTAELFEALLDKNAVVIGSSVFEGPMSEHPEIEEAKKNGTWGVDENKPAATAKPAAAAVTPVRTSSIPKTSDDSNLLLWVCLMGIAALGLGGAVYMKKRNHQ